MTLNFCQIQKLTTELAALECLKINVSFFLSVAIDLILFKLAGKEKMYTILGVFEVWPDWTTDNLSIQTIPPLGYNRENGLYSFFLAVYLL